MGLLANAARDAFIHCLIICAVDALSSSMTMDAPRSAFSTSSSSTLHSSSSASDQNPGQRSNVDPEEIRATRGVPEPSGGESGNGNGSGGRCSTELGDGRVTSQEAPPHHQLTPSKRRTVLNISPPPQDLFDDSHVSCQDETSLDSEQSNSIWMDDTASNFSIMSTVSYNDNTEVPRKSRKRTPRQRPGPKSVRAEEASMDMFDADSAKGPLFVLSQLGPDNKTGPKGRCAQLLPCTVSVSSCQSKSMSTVHVAMNDVISKFDIILVILNDLIQSRYH